MASAGGEGGGGGGGGDTGTGKRFDFSQSFQVGSSSLSAAASSASSAASRDKSDTKRSFKSAIRGDVQREKRRGMNAAVSKARRHALLNKRRRLARSSSAGAAAAAVAAAGAIQQEQEQEEEEGNEPNGALKASQAELEHAIAQLMDAAAAQATKPRYVQEEEEETQLGTALSAVRDVLSNADLEHMDMTSLPRLAEALIAVGLNREGADAEHRLAAAWALTNIASAPLAIAKSVAPAAPFLVHLLSWDQGQLAMQAAWCLGNLASEPSLLPALWSAGGGHALCSFIVEGAHATLSHARRLFEKGGSGEEQTSIALDQTLLEGNQALSIATWALHVALFAPPAGMEPAEEIVQTGICKAVVSLIEYALEAEAGELAKEACWALVGLVRMSPVTAEAVLEAEGHITICSVLGIAVEHNDVSLALPAIRATGYISAGPDAFSFALVQAGVLHGLAQCLSPEQQQHRGILKEAAWCVCNIAGGGPELMDAIVSANFIPLLARLFEDASFDVGRELAFALYNLARDGRYISDIVQSCEGVFIGFIRLIRVLDADTIAMALRFIDLTLKHVDGAKLMFQELEGVAALESLQRHENRVLWSMADRMMDLYFGEDEEAEAQAALAFSAAERERVEREEAQLAEWAEAAKRGEELPPRVVMLLEERGV